MDGELRLRSETLITEVRETSYYIEDMLVGTDVTELGVGKEEVPLVVIPTNVVLQGIDDRQSLIRDLQVPTDSIRKSGRYMVATVVAMTCLYEVILESADADTTSRAEFGIGGVVVAVAVCLTSYWSARRAARRQQPKIDRQHAEMVRIRSASILFATEDSV